MAVILLAYCIFGFMRVADGLNVCSSNSYFIFDLVGHYCWIGFLLKLCWKLSQISLHGITFVMFNWNIGIMEGFVGKYFSLIKSRFVELLTVSYSYATHFSCLVGCCFLCCMPKNQSRTFGNKGCVLGLVLLRAVRAASFWAISYPIPFFYLDSNLHCFIN